MPAKVHAKGQRQEALQQNVPAKVHAKDSNRRLAMSVTTTPDCASGASVAMHQTEWQLFGSRWPHLPTDRARRWPNRWGPADC